MHLIRLLLVSVLAMGVNTMTMAKPVPLNANGLSSNVSIADAKKLPDDHKVTITGQIVRSLGDERYEVKDSTGHIIVEIDDDDWHGKAIYAGQKVKICGEIDRDDDEPVEIEADSVTILSH